MEALESPASIVLGTKSGYSQEYHLNRLHFTIGSQVDADIMHPSLLLDHAELRFEAGNWVIKKRNPDAVLSYKGIPVTLKKLNPGDIIEINDTFLKYIGKVRAL